MMAVSVGVNIVTLSDFMEFVNNILGRSIIYLQYIVFGVFISDV